MIRTFLILSWVPWSCNFERISSTDSFNFWFSCRSILFSFSNFANLLSKFSNFEIRVCNYIISLTGTRMAVPLLSGIEVFCKNFAFPFELGPVRPPSPGLTFYGGSFSVCIIFLRFLEVIEIDPWNQPKKLKIGGQAPSNLDCAKLARSINPNRIVLHVEGDKVSLAEMIMHFHEKTEFSWNMSFSITSLYLP